MALVKHSGIGSIERQLENFAYDLNHETFGRDRGSADKLLKSAHSVRTSFRKKLRDCADHKIVAKSASNGQESFQSWKKGFEFAETVAGKKVYYYDFDNSNSFVAFHESESLAKIEKIIKAYEERVVDLKNDLEVMKVMES
jgi:hypothetical protein